MDAQYIEIIATPAGEAPDWVREAWVGCILPIRGPARVLTSSGVISGNPERVPGYCVPLEEALRSLERRGQKDAANWWRNLRLQEDLIFKAEGCR